MFLNEINKIYMQLVLSGLLAHCFKVLSYGALFLPLQKRALQACGYSSVNAEFARGLSKFAMEKKKKGSFKK